MSSKKVGGLMRQVARQLRLFLNGALLSYVALFRWLHPTTYLASKVIMPLNQLLFFTLLGVYATGQENAGFFVVGNAIQVAAVSGIYGVTMSIGGDRWAGTLPYLFGTPASRMIMFVGRAFMHIIDGILGVIVGLSFGGIFLGLDFSQTDPLILAITILITTLSTSGLGLLLGCLSLITRNVMFVNNTVYFLLLAFSGANIPLSSMPAWMRTLSSALPLSRGIAAARKVIHGDPHVANLLGGELIIGVGYITLGYFLFRWFEIAAKKRGTLEAF
jgi:ABC-2 type transport system permease protein